MRKSATWQLAFILGAVALVLCTAIVLGSAFFTTASAVAAIIIAIIHSLLADKEEADHRNWLARIARSYLQVSRVLITATVCEFLITIGILIYGIISWHIAHNTVTVKGIVLTAHGEPIDNATVALKRNGSQVAMQITNHGSYEMRDVLVDDNTMLAARWHGSIIESKVTASVARMGSLPAIVFPMSASQSPFRVTYFEIEGYAVGYLLKGQLTGKWQHAIPGNPYVAENEEFNYLRGLGQKSLEPKTDDPEFYSLDLTKAERSEISKLSQSGIPPSAFSEHGPESFATAEDLRSIAAGSDDFGLIIYNPALEQNGAEFWRLATRDDLAKFSGSPSVELYRTITEGGWPREFAALLYSIGCGDPIWSVELLVRTVVVGVGVLENTSSQPIQIDGFSVRENTASSPRDAEEDRNALQGAAETRKQYFPTGSSLMPGEKLLIPLRTVMVYENDGTDFIDDKKSDRDAWLEKYGSKPYELHNQDGSLASSLDPILLHKYANNQSLEPALAKDFVVGPSAQLVSVYIQGEPYNIRQEQAASLVLRDDVGLGSCPYLYTRTVKSKEWRAEGTILTGMNNRQKKRLQSKQLHDFDGFVRILEKETEISHLDAIWVEDTGPEGKTTVLRPEDPRLSDLDNREVILKKGQSITVKFRDFVPAMKHKYVIRTVGYYTPTVPRAPGVSGQPK